MLINNGLVHGRLEEISDGVYTDILEIKNPEQQTYLPRKFGWKQPKDV